MASQPGYNLPEAAPQAFGSLPSVAQTPASFSSLPSHPAPPGVASGLQQLASGGQQVMLMHPGVQGARAHESHTSGPTATATSSVSTGADVAMVDNMIGVPPTNALSQPTTAPAAASATPVAATATPTAPSSTSATSASQQQQPPIAMYQIPAAMTATPGFPTEHAVLVPYATQMNDGGANDEGNMNRTMRKHAWTTQEDETLMRMVHAHGPGRWSQVASHLPGRLGKQCRERWFNHLAPEVRKGAWTADEDRLIMNSVREMGTKWSSIVKLLPGRSDNAIKNRYYSAIRKAHRQESRAHDVHSQQDENERAAKEAAQIAAASLGIDLRHAGASSATPALTLAPSAAEGVTAEAVVASNDAPSASAPDSVAAGRTTMVQAPMGVQTLQMQTANGQYQTLQIPQGGMIMQVPVVQTSQGGTVMMQQPVQLQQLQQMQAIQVPPGMQIAGLQPGQRQYVQLMQVPQSQMPPSSAGAPATAGVVIQAVTTELSPTEPAPGASAPTDGAAAEGAEPAPAEQMVTNSSAAPASAEPGSTDAQEGNFLAPSEWDGI
ncbi:MAG: hypothetical protein SGPRY_003234 [Prymnesium sp.]